MSWYKHPRTTQEMRHSCDRFDEEIHDYGRVKFRAKRNKVNLPSAWWDRDVVVERSWKDHREKQYHPKGPKKVKKHGKFRGGPVFVRPVWEWTRLNKTKTGWFRVYDFSKRGYVIRYETRKYVEHIRGPFLGYKLLGTWKRAGGTTTKIFSEEEMRKRGFSIYRCRIY